MIPGMRRMAAILCMIGVLVFSVAVGWVAADWPAWCLRLQWCGEHFPR
jgi:hypothetical protein